MIPTIDGKELRQRRLALGLSNQMLGKHLGVAANTINRWELGLLPIGQPVLLARAMRDLETGVIRNRELQDDIAAHRNWLSKREGKPRGGWSGSTMIRPRKEVAASYNPSGAGALAPTHDAHKDTP